MDKVIITIEAFGQKVPLEPIDADIAAAWMRGRGIDLSDPAAALKQASVLIVRPIIEEGCQVQADEAVSEINARRDAVLLDALKAL